MNDAKGVWYKAWGAPKSVLNNRSLGINVKKCRYDGVIVLTALYGEEARCMRSTKRLKVNILKLKYLRSLVGVSRMARVRNEEEHMRERECV